MTPISLPPSAPFPVTVTSINHQVGETIRKHALLLKFKYWDYQEDPGSKEAVPHNVRVERIGTLESPIEGQIVSVNIALNEEVAHSGVELFQVEEPCSHTVQYGGLCALCGKAVEDEKDYSGYTYEDRATIAMSHDNTGLRISLEEAKQIEHNATERLTEAKKLILVVDLDQTVIHATVDPTVGEWQHDPKNPNYRFVSDVRSFFLEEDPATPPNFTVPRPGHSKCWYYVKLRPGLKNFLKHVSSLYELHIYTMATRSYALAISNIIDPTGEYFGDRILSRDESGLLTHKNLKRLFPVDQSMVAIIDDRGDVWQWEANLIKVVPYDFFVGIGDINLSFLPKKNGQLLRPSKKLKAIARLEAVAETETDQIAKSALDEADNETPKEKRTTDPYNNLDQKSSKETVDAEQDARTDYGEAPVSSPSSPVDRIVLLGGGEDSQNLLAKQLKIRNKVMEQQQHDRPLARLQHNLDMAIQGDHEGSNSDSDGKEDEEYEHLLYDDDKELIYLESALEKFHAEYYRQFSMYQKDDSRERPDLTKIIPRLKQECLQGLVVLFSGILPLGMDIDQVDMVIWCRQFGVRVVTEVYPDVTHVVCRDPNSSFMKPGLTLKVRVARKILPNVKVVNPDWLFACLSQWRVIPSEEYEVNVSEQDWYVSDSDVKKYQTAFDAQVQHATVARSTIDGRSDSVGSIEDFDLNEASDEVDDFLAGISDESDESDDDHNRIGDDDINSRSNANGSSFVKSLYSAKRKVEEADLDESEVDQDVIDPPKKQKTESDVHDIDELEQELLEEFDHLSD